MNAVGDLARALRSEADATNERRLFVLTGERATTDDVARDVVDATDLRAVTLAGRPVVGRRIPLERADELLGATHECVVVDCHDACRPNALGRATGAVDGGGLLVLLVPPLDRWADRRDDFDATLAVPPFDVGDVEGRFRERLIETLRAHRGVAIVDVDDGRVVDDGLTHPAPRLAPKPIQLPDESAFPAGVYQRCHTADQRDAVLACESLRDEDRAVVLESDRGRGKSSAAGLAAAAFATEGDRVLVTAPRYRNAAEVFDRAAEALEGIGALFDDRSDGVADRELRADGGGAITFRSPAEATKASADVLVVDEAAALPVHRLEALLAVAPSTCFATTVHGYEGAGRGFDVRFRDRLADERRTRTVTLSEPIRYAAADPVEVWLFRALMLDARPAVAPLVEDAQVSAATYERLDRDTLAADEGRLREVFGLLVAAHYRTEPDDLARLLDAPNVAVRALTVDGRIVSVALLAREGGLAESLRQAMYEGARVRGNMIPDVLTSQLRDLLAGVPVGVRVMRIATHHAVRSAGFGSRLLAEIAAEFDGGAGENSASARFGDVDYLCVGYGATPALLSFWDDNGYATIHLSTTRNETSGEYSALMVRPLTAAGAELADRHAEWFIRRISSVLADALSDADPDVVCGALAATDTTVSLGLSDIEWRLVASAAYGPGLYDVAPRPFRRLALRALVDGAVDELVDRRLLVAKVLQTRPWDEVASELGYVSRRQCMRALGDAYEPLVDGYGGEVAREEADRY